MVNDNQATSKKKDISKSTEYHGIVIDFSQKDKSIFNTVEVIGKHPYFFGLMNIYKLKVPSGKIDGVIKAFQKNMANRFLLSFQDFYLHFYRDNELIIVFKDKVFHVTPDSETWGEAIEHGKKLKIATNQLDFYPCRFEDEDF
jgi:hypothetical protein